MKKKEYEVNVFDSSLNDEPAVTFATLLQAIAWLKASGFRMRGDLIVNDKRGVQALVWFRGVTIDSTKLAKEGL